MNEEQPAFKIGYQDFNNGQTMDDCPYPKESFDRLYWYKGWLEARTNKNVGHILDKYEHLYSKGQEISNK